MDDARHLVLPSDLTSSLHPSRECPGPHGQDAGWIHAEITRPVVLIVLVLAGQTGVKNTCEDDQLRLVHRVRELDDVEVVTARFGTTGTGQLPYSLKPAY